MDLFNLFIKISAKDDATQALGKVKSETDKTTNKLEKLNTGLKKVGDGIKTSFSVMSKVVVGTTGAFTAGIAAINKITESTREYREDIGKLTTAFETAGISQEAATDTYRSFFSVIGEEDRSVEAVSHLAKLTQSQEDLKKWTDICAGVWGTFGDSLPIEGLTEAANETAKVGQVTGPLADALNWAGVNEDEFNQSLAACNDEQERATLITDTLNGLYKDAAENYKAANGEIMNARYAQSLLTDATAELGSALEPVSTVFKFFGADIVNDIVPGVEKIGEGLKGIFYGNENAGEELGQGLTSILDAVIDNVERFMPIISDTLFSIAPSLITNLTSFLPKLTEVAFSIITSLVQGLSSNSQQIATSAMQIISTLFTGIVQNLPTILDSGLDIILTLAEGIVQYLPQIFDSLVELITTIATKLTEPDMLLKIINVALDLILALVDGLGKALPQLISVMPTIIMNIATALIKSLPKIISTGVQLINSLISGIKSMFSALGKAGTDLMGKIITAIKNKLSEIKQKGKDIINNLLSGLKEKWESVKSWFSNAWDNLFGGKSVDVNVNKSGASVDGSHANGLSYVPFDGYIAELHRGERVLTAQENMKYNDKTNNSGVTVNQYIYAQKQSAADLMKQALYQQKRAVTMGV